MNISLTLRQAICGCAMLCACVMLSWGQGKEKTHQLPVTVKDALTARFPKAHIDKWTKEEEKGVVVYDVEFTQSGIHCEADVTEAGTVDNWEKAVTVKDLPPAVKEAVDKTYPKSTIKEVMLVTVVKEGKDQMEGYEISLRTAAKKKVEMTIAQDGKVLEDSGK